MYMLKLQRLRYVHDLCNFILTHIPSFYGINKSFFTYRAGIIPLEEAEKSYSDDVEFWLARLKMIEDDTSVYTLI